MNVVVVYIDGLITITIREQPRKRHILNRSSLLKTSHVHFIQARHLPKWSPGVKLGDNLFITLESGN